MAGGYTQSVPAPTPWRLFFFYLVVSFVLFLRPPTTNFIFDEQEALLANPYLWGDGSFLSAFEVDFWGRPLKTTIGSYRPLPNLLWRPLAFSLKWRTPWLLQLLNLTFHAGTATLLARALLGLEKDRSAHTEQVAWLFGGLFSVLALSTEAVCSVVGLADILVGFCSVACLGIVIHFARALPAQGNGPRTILSWASFSVCLSSALLLGLFCKETMLSFLPLVCGVALLVWEGAPPRANKGRLLFTVLSGLSSLGALACYVFVRRTFYSGSASSARTLDGSFSGILRPFFRWFAQPPLPADPMNNPLLSVEPNERWITGAEVFTKQLAQIPFPVGLSGDYSFPAQPVASLGAFSLLGGVLFASLVGLGLVLAVQVLRGRASSGARLIALGALWIPATYLPVSNALVLLPTVRADRLMYLPSIGAVILIVASVRLLWPWVIAWVPSKKTRLSVVVAILSLQAVAARYYATDYTSDLVFWRRVSGRSPASAKAHLNYGVMVGARGNHRARLLHTERAVQLAPTWPMGRVYLADTYCRLGEMERAMKEYLPALELSANSKTLTALSLQCIWEKGAFAKHQHALMDLAFRHPDTWLHYFVHQLTTEGERHQGISPLYRPRRYNEQGGPEALAPPLKK